MNALIFSVLIGSVVNIINDYNPLPQKLLGALRLCFFIVVLDVVWHLHRFLQCIKYVTLELPLPTPSLLRVPRCVCESAVHYGDKHLRRSAHRGKVNLGSWWLRLQSMVRWPRDTSVHHGRSMWQSESETGLLHPRPKLLRSHMPGPATHPLNIK
jgi:hypothetical protein